LGTGFRAGCCPLGTHGPAMEGEPKDPSTA